MKSPAGCAWEGFLASLLLHLAAAAVVLYGMTLGPAPKLPMIDLSLLPPTAAGRADAYRRPTSGGGNGPARNAAPTAGPSPPTVPDRPTTREAVARELVPAASSPAESSPHASIQAMFSSGSGPELLSPPSSAARGGTSPMPGYGFLREAIQREISYPPVARRMGWEGRVVVAFVILPDGAVRDVRVVRGSGFAVLDRNAVEAVRSASPFPHPPAEAEVLTPVVYRLE